MRGVGVSEMFFLSFGWLSSLVIPVVGLYLLWRGVAALEAIAKALRDRRQDEQ